MKYWRDRKHVVHLVDGADFRWCDESGQHPVTHNTNDTPTCLRCWGEWINYARQRAS